MRGIALLFVLVATGIPAGAMSASPSPMAGAAARLPALPNDDPGAAPADSVRRGALLEKLQREDTGFYEPDIFEMNRALADSGMAALDSLGIDAFERETMRGTRRLRFDVEPAPHLLTYNRVEGPVVGLGPSLHLPVLAGVRLQAEGAWATASEEFRHYETLTAPLSVRPGAPEFEAGFTERVEPFGSNRPTANLVRAVVGSADEQDYLERRGGWGQLRWAPGSVSAAALCYEAFRERSVDVHTDFALLGNHRLLETNPAVDEGIDRALEARLTLGSLAYDRQELSLSHRVAGGALGGDFTYTRFDAAGSVRRYLPGNFEAVLDVAYVHLGGDAPFQRLADVGGLGTARGFDRRSRLGRESLSARLELPVPYDLFGRSGIPLVRRLKLQFVPWADAARVWSPAGCGCGEAPEPWLTSAGLGLQYFLGPFGEGSYLRLDLAGPIGPDRPDDLRLYLRFARGLF